MKTKTGDEKKESPKTTIPSGKQSALDNEYSGDENNDDDVTNIHKRYSLTLINPSSHYVSLVSSIVIVSVIVILSNLYYLDTKWQDIASFHVPLAVFALLATQFIDSKLIKTDYSKSLHISLFGNLLWLLTVSAGLIGFYLFSKTDLSYAYLMQGVLFFTGFRMCLFVSVAGTSFKKSIPVSFLQPVLLIVSLVPLEKLAMVITNANGVVFGFAFVAIGLVWAVLSDRAGRPALHSTHRLLQAYLQAATKEYSTPLEKIMEKRSVDETVGTYQLRFYDLSRGDSDTTTRDKTKTQQATPQDKNQNVLCTVVLPDIHPGPFHPIGGSNITFQIYKRLDYSAVIMHSISDHSFNLPSEAQVNEYLEGISQEATHRGRGAQCSTPVIQIVGNARVTGLRFGDDTVLLMLSLSPHGMEDIPLSLRQKLEKHGSELGFSNLVVIDCHNAMGPTISGVDYDSMMKAAILTIDKLGQTSLSNFMVGYASYFPSENKEQGEVGPAGIAAISIRVGKDEFTIGWADSNNMQNGVREKVVDYLESKGYNLVELCTSDTHYRQDTVRNREGYFSFGSVTSPETIASWFEKLTQESTHNMLPASYALLYNEKRLKLMGPDQFRHYSISLDKSMKITKIFVSITVGFFLVTSWLL